MENQEFKNKYGFEKPEDSRERDMIIMSNLSNLQIEVGMFSQEEVVEKLNTIKQFMIDSKL